MPLTQEEKQAAKTGSVRLYSTEGYVTWGKGNRY